MGIHQVEREPSVGAAVSGGNGPCTQLEELWLQAQTVPSAALTFSGSRSAATITTTWNFTDAGGPQQNQVNAPYTIMGRLFGDTSPAAYEPLLLLNYDIPLAADNTALADRSLTFTVHAAGTRPGSGADTKELRLEDSFDDGATWTTGLVRRLGDGRFQATVQHPPLAASTGAVSLRTSTRDVFGNDVIQTIADAYGLRAPSHCQATTPRSGWMAVSGIGAADWPPATGDRRPGP